MRIRIDWPATISALLITATLAVFPLINPCQTETSSVCTWNASTTGNSLGTSFTNYYGLQINHP